MHPDRIIFVYNESRGLFDAVSGWTHKLLSPASYQCALCKVTFGLTGMLVAWKNYVELLPATVVFLHRDEFRKQFPAHASLPLPVILAESSAQLSVLLSANDIQSVSGIGGLIGLTQQRLEELTAELPRVTTGTKPSD